MTETEMAALIKRQQQLQQQQKAAAAAGGTASPSGLQTNLASQQTVQIGTASSSAGITTAQLLAQAGLQVGCSCKRKRKNESQVFDLAGSNCSCCWRTTPSSYVS